MVCKLFLIQTGTATLWHSVLLFSSVVTFMVMSPFSETCSTQCLGLLVTPLEPFVVVSPSAFSLPFFIHRLFYPHLKVWKGLCLYNATPRLLTFTCYVVRSKYSGYTDTYMVWLLASPLCAQWGFSHTRAQSLQSNKTKGLEERHGGRPGINRGKRKTLWMWNVGPNHSRHHRLSQESIKGPTHHPSLCLCQNRWELVPICVRFSSQHIK